MELNKIYNMDCLKGMKQLKNNSIDLIITDPPYNIGYKSGMGSKEYIENMQKTEWDKNFCFKPYFNELWRVLKKDGIMFVFSRFDTLLEYKTYLTKDPKSVLIWDKMDYGMGDLTWFSLSYEIILVYCKGKPKLNLIKPRPNGVIKCYKVQCFANGEKKPTGKKEGQDFMDHPTQKPLKLIRYLLKYASKPDDIVVSNFLM